jgi:cytochrome c peroxidase
MPERLGEHKKPVSGGISAMKKYLLIAVVLLAVFMLALPVYNLYEPLPLSRLSEVKTDSPETQAVIKVLQTKCMSCHTTTPKLPFYAMFPIAKQLMARDIRVGSTNIDYVKEFLPDTPRPVSEAALAKTEYAIAHNMMPPPQYLLLHWNHTVSESDKAVFNAWVKKERLTRFTTEGVPTSVVQNVLRPVVQTAQTDPAKVALGEKLYHDKRLSKDNSLACAGCHELSKGGTDQAKVSTGVGGILGPINSPTTYNAVFNVLQFWDGRAADLQAQADGPVNNPKEMASNWAEAIPKLKEDAELTAAFNDVYVESYTKETITEAIAEFEKTLVTPNSPFDKFLMGRNDALSDEQKKGYSLFLDYACATCHAGAAMGGQSFEKMGLKADYFADRGNPTDADLGRFSATKDEADKHRFKVPALRNIAKTFPYLHDGSTNDLKEVVGIMAKYQVGRAISDTDKASVAEFLKSLTGEYKGQPLP